VKVKLVGCGFLGSLFTEELAKWSRALHLDMTMDVCDPDTVSERNVANQLFTPADVGIHKVNVVGQRLWDYNVGGDSFTKLLTPETSDEILAGADIYVCAVDNIKARQLMWTKSIQNDVPLLNLGVSQQGTGSVDWTCMSNGIDTNPFGLTQGQTEEQLAAYGQLNAELPPCELVGFRGVGLNMALAATKSLLILWGWDPEMVVHKTKGQQAPWGTFTTWLARTDGHSLVQTMVAKEEE